MTYKLGTRSMQSLSGVHPDLVEVGKLAITITGVDFTVIEGIRNINRQRELYKAGKSTTMNSRHIPTAETYWTSPTKIVFPTT